MIQQTAILLNISFAEMSGQPFNEYVTFSVGGLLFTLNKANINRFPDTFLANLVKPVWKTYGEDPIVIERDGELFFYIADYIRYGVLPRDKSSRLMIDDATRKRLILEADYFQLFELVKECKEQSDAEINCFPHMNLRNMIEGAIENCKKSTQTNWTVPAEVVHLDIEEATGEAAPIEEYERFAKLLGHITAPFCITGKLDTNEFEEEDEDEVDYYRVYKSSSMGKLNMEELLAEATLSPFGKGSETVVDTSVRHSYEIDLSHLETYAIDPDCAADISSLNSDRDNQALTFRPYKLAIYKEGGHFEAHRDTVRGEEHIGTLVLILNSEYTGGELEVTHGDRTVVVTGPYSWVAMYGDCLHKINPVTSGTRVSLIYDICSIPRIEWRASLGVWDAMDCRVIPPSAILRGVDETQKLKVIEGMREQLRGFDSAVICLQHLYPACQANPDFLKGGDQLLYDILRDHFTLAVLPCTIYRKKIYGDESYGRKDTFCVKPWRVPGLYDAHAALVDEAFHLKTNFIIFEHLSRKQILEYEDIDYTGNESQGEETLYKVAGLQVRKQVGVN